MCESDALTVGLQDSPPFELEDSLQAGLQFEFFILAALKKIFCPLQRLCEVLNQVIFQIFKRQCNTK